MMTAADFQELRYQLPPPPPPKPPPLPPPLRLKPLEPRPAPKRIPPKPLQRGRGCDVRVEPMSISYCLCSAVQFKTTVIGEDVARSTMVFRRKRWPRSATT